MIAIAKAIKRDRSAQPVADPRRSYDRGIWVGELAGECQPVELATFSIDSLRRELGRRRKALETAIARRAKLAAELEAVEAEILRTLPAERQAGRPSRRTPGPGQPARLILPRLKNSISLPDALAVAVEVRALVSPTEAAQLVRANGFQTASKSFVAAVSNALARDGRFKRIGRGRYERVAS